MFTNDEAMAVTVEGLKNAHAMEKQALSIMEPQVKRLEHYPDLEARLKDHIAETKGQIERLDTIFEDLQENHSGFKDMVLSMGGAMAALSHAAAGDEILKDSFANLAFENYEIGAYKSLIQLTKGLGLPNITPLLQQTLDEERAMAQWMADNIGPITDRYVELRSHQATAQR